MAPNQPDIAKQIDQPSTVPRRLDTLDNTISLGPPTWTHQGAIQPSTMIRPRAKKVHNDRKADAQATDSRNTDHLDKVTGYYVTMF